MTTDTTLFRNGWALGARGLLALALGGAVFVQPTLTLTALVLLFGGYALLDGLLALASAVVPSAAPRETWHARWWALPLEGLIGVAIGIAAFVATGMSSPALVWLVGIWAVATGVVEIVTALQLRREVPGELLLLFGGASSVALGVVLFGWRDAGAAALVTILGAYALVFGATIVALALRIRRLPRDDGARRLGLASRAA